MKKVLVISTSLRTKSNSEYLAREFMRGAADAGNETEFISLNGKEIRYCIGCLSCQLTKKCAINDDAREIAEKVRTADVVVFATPVYYYCMSGQMKTLLDRMNSLYTSDYSFRDIYLLATAADTDESAIDGTVVGLDGWIECYEKCSLKGVLRGVGLNDSDEVKAHPEIVKKAYDMGNSI